MPGATDEATARRARLEERARALDEHRERQTRTDLGAFIERVSRGRFQRPTHIAPLLEAFDDIERGIPVFATVAVPPRHGKSEALLHAAARHLRWRPDRIVAYATYSQAFANRKSRRAREIARAAGLWLNVQPPGKGRAPSIGDPSASVQFWQTAAGGGFIAVGRGGPLKGEGVHCLLIDDPYANREEVESTTIRGHVQEWFQGVAFDRIEPGGSCIIAHQRWHEDDLTGFVQRELTGGADAQPWRHINLPALSDDERPLWPERYTADVLRRIRRTIGEYNWASQFQGQPRGRGGKLFREPARFEAVELQGKVVVISADTASSEKRHADWTVIVVQAFSRDRGTGLLRSDVVEVRRGQWEAPRICEELRAAQTSYRGAPIVIEAIGEGRAIAQMLRSIDRSLRILEERPTADKFTRAQAASAAWNDSRVRVPVGLPWVAPFLAVVQGFSGVGDRHDDDVDALCHGWNWAERNIQAPQRIGPAPVARSRRAMAESPF